jgi:hypothetical protein
LPHFFLLCVCRCLPLRLPCTHSLFFVKKDANAS